MNALTIPQAAQDDANATHMLSAWIANKGLHCEMNQDMWEKGDEAEGWGMLLAEMVRQIAKAERAKSGAKPDQTIDAIVERMLDELNDPASPAPGSFDAG